MEKEIMPLRNYAHIGDAIWEVFVRDYTILQTSNSKILHKITTDRVKASFQKEMLEYLAPTLTEEEQELARRGRNLPIPVARRSIQHEFRPATAFEVLVGYWYIHDKARLNAIFDIFKQTEWFN